MSADSAGAGERERLARVLAKYESDFTHGPGERLEPSGEWPFLNEPVDGSDEWDLWTDLADALLAAGFGDVAQAEAERDAALAVIAELAAALPDVLDSAASCVEEIHREWVGTILPDDDEDIVAINAVRAILTKATA